MINRLDPFLGENPVFNTEQWAQIIDAELDFHFGKNPVALTIPRS